MSLTLQLTTEELRGSVDGAAISLPVGLARLLACLGRNDPPRPEDLTNTIGLVADHLDDLLRELPQALDGPVLLGGAVMRSIAAVEVGAEVAAPFVIHRDAAEEVFRTLATEPATSRARNPGLAAGDVELAVAACCALVAVLRTLRLAEIELTW